jgi:hypothetical protein
VPQAAPAPPLRSPKGTGAPTGAVVHSRGDGNEPLKAGGTPQLAERTSDPLEGLEQSLSSLAPPIMAMPPVEAAVAVGPPGLVWRRQVGEVGVERAQGGIHAIPCTRMAHVHGTRAWHGRDASDAAHAPPRYCCHAQGRAISEGRTRGGTGDHRHGVAS